jgi:hypothetical protein
MSLFNLASKYGAPAIAALLLALVSGLYVRGNVLESQRDSARVERDDARTVILGLQDQAKNDAIDLALLRQSKAAIDDTAANQDARTLATVTRQSHVLANIEKELRDARSNLEGVDTLGGTLTRVLSDQRDAAAAALQSRARRIAGDESSAVRPAGEPKSGANDTATDARHDGHVGRGDHRQPVDLRSHTDWLGGDWLVRFPELAGAVAEPEDVSQSEENSVWLMEVHAWSTETHDRAPAFHRIGSNAVTAVFPEMAFTGSEACKLHSYHVIKEHYAAAKAVDKSLSFRSMVFCARVPPEWLEGDSPYRADWRHVSALFLNSVGEHV